MAIGKTLADIVTAMGTAARQANHADAAAALETVRAEVLEDAACEQPWRFLEDIRRVVDSNLGYLAGYLPSEYGNAVLRMLDVEHPVFGKSLNVSTDEALAAGMMMAEQLREVRLAEERKAKIAAKRAAGLDLPDIDKAISSADAKELFEKLRAMKAAKGGVISAPVTDETSKYGHMEPAPRDVTVVPLADLVAKAQKDKAEREAKEQEMAAALAADIAERERIVKERAEKELADMLKAAAYDDKNKDIGAF